MRVLLSVPIHVSGKDRKDRQFEEETRTLVVNAHGALISLAAAVIAGQQITVANHATEQTRDCRVVYLGSAASGKIQMGIEFVKPSPTIGSSPKANGPRERNLISRPISIPRE
jgi:hypothetical protein